MKDLKSTLDDEATDFTAESLNSDQDFQKSNALQSNLICLAKEKKEKKKVTGNNL